MLREPDGAAADWPGNGLPGAMECRDTEASVKRDSILEYLTSEVSSELEDLRQFCVRNTDSPIEAEMLAALVASAIVNRNNQWLIMVEECFPIRDRPVFELGSSEAAGVDHQLEIRPQMHIGNHRVDIALCLRRRGVTVVDGEQQVAFGWSQTLVIECDGHAFHERTPDQALADKSRDRELMLLGVGVMRFTGREIYRDAQACAEQAIDWMESSVSKLENFSPL